MLMKQAEGIWDLQWREKKMRECNKEQSGSPLPAKRPGPGRKKLTLTGKTQAEFQAGKISEGVKC